MWFNINDIECNSWWITLYHCTYLSQMGYTRGVQSKTSILEIEIWRVELCLLSSRLSNHQSCNLPFQLQ